MAAATATSTTTTTSSPSPSSLFVAASASTSTSTSTLRLCCSCVFWFRLLPLSHSLCLSVSLCIIGKGSTHSSTFTLVENFVCKLAAPSTANVLSDKGKRKQKQTHKNCLCLLASRTQCAPCVHVVHVFLATTVVSQSHDSSHRSQRNVEHTHTYRGTLLV